MDPGEASDLHGVVRAYTTTDAQTSKRRKGQGGSISCNLFRDPHSLVNSNMETPVKPGLPVGGPPLIMPHFDPGTAADHLDGSEPSRRSPGASVRTRKRPRRVSIHRMFSNLFRSNLPPTPFTPSTNNATTPDYFSYTSGSETQNSHAEHRHAPVDEVPTNIGRLSAEVEGLHDPTSNGASHDSPSHLRPNSTISQPLGSTSHEHRRINRTQTDASDLQQYNFRATSRDSSNVKESKTESFMMEPQSGPPRLSSSDSHERYYRPLSSPDDSKAQEVNDRYPLDMDFLPPGPAQQDSPPAPLLPVAVVALLATYLDHATWKASRLTCPTWYHGLTRARPPRMPAVYYLPTELLQHLYSYLGPVDFDAARHTCHAWLQASLDRSLLAGMLKRGGWHSAAPYDVDPTQRGVYQSTHLDSSSALLNRSCPATMCSQNWMLSRMLSRECSLRSDWTGNGLSSTAYASYASPRPAKSWTQSVEKSPRSRIKHQSSFVQVSITDFSELSESLSTADDGNTCGLLFTVSTCGEFLLVAEGCLIYVFELLPDGGMRPFAGVICPKRVLAMSMDTSSRRFALAALMDGRTGMVCDLQSRIRMRKRAGSPQDEPHGLNNSLSGGKLHTAPSPARKPADSVSPGRHYRSPYPSRSRISPQPLLFSENLSLYTSLCSDDDLPRSVAICPSRRCVAFGCSTGIELHWVDAVTLRCLNRWFPLTSPSDNLYFLPPRKTAGETGKRLRIISSAGPPNERLGIRRRVADVGSNRASRVVNLCCGTLDFEGQASAYGSNTTAPSSQAHRVTLGGAANVWPGAQLAAGTMVSRGYNYDHYRAIPVSDGHHFLFIDPATYQLCLGVDAPIGGPTKLLKRIIFLSRSEDQPITVYASGRDLTWGLRIVAAYGDRLILFSIPPDVLEASRYADTSPQTDTGLSYGSRTSASAPNAQDGDSDEEYPEWYQHWPDAKESQSPHPAPRSGIFPLRLQGVEVDTVKSIIDLSISSGLDFAIWAFSADGFARAWKVSGRGVQSVKERIVARDGSVVDRFDSDGDVSMLDAGPVWPNLTGLEDGFSISEGQPTAMLRSNMLDGDGDYPMPDADSIAMEVNNLEADIETDLETPDAPSLLDDPYERFSPVITGLDGNTDSVGFTSSRTKTPSSNKSIPSHALDGASDVAARLATTPTSFRTKYRRYTWDRELEPSSCTKFHKVRAVRKRGGRRWKFLLGDSGRPEAVSEGDELEGGGVQGRNEGFTVWCSVHRVYRDEKGEVLLR